MHGRRKLKTVCAAGLAALFSFCGQDSDSRPTCLSQVDVDSCTPLYPAEFPVIYRQVLSATCASAGVSCHGPGGGNGGIVFATDTEAHAELLGHAGDRALVIPGDPACSELVVRLDLSGHSWSMPPSAPLDERARCSIRRWIADGALAMPGQGP